MLLNLSRCPSKQNWSWLYEASLLTWADGKEKANSPITLVSDLQWKDREELKRRREGKGGEMWRMHGKG